MKRAIVPAQITTVEDRIVGGLTPYQLALLLLPLCTGFIAYALLPPNFHLVIYKLVGVIVLELIGATLAIRIKDRLLLFWLLIIGRYNARPRFYVYDKNDTFLRDLPTEQAAPADEPEAVIVKDATQKPAARPHLGLPEIVKLEAIISDPRANLRFKAGKDGKLNAIITEIK